MKKIRNYIKKEFTFKSFKYVMGLIRLSWKQPVVKILYPVLILFCCLDLFTEKNITGLATFLSFIVFIYVITLVDATKKVK